MLVSVSHTITMSPSFSVCFFSVKNSLFAGMLLGHIGFREYLGFSVTGTTLAEVVFSFLLHCWMTLPVTTVASPTRELGMA